jgi:hypothetical protein
MSLGRDIWLHPPQKGDPLNYYAYPYAELDGKPFHRQEKRLLLPSQRSGGRQTCMASC